MSTFEKSSAYQQIT